jgi:hypothetical protein
VNHNGAQVHSTCSVHSLSTLQHNCEDYYRIRVVCDDVTLWNLNFVNRTRDLWVVMMRDVKNTQVCRESLNATSSITILSVSDRKQKLIQVYLMSVPCIIRRSRNNQHYAQICTTALSCMLAPTCFRSSLPSSGGRLLLKHVGDSIYNKAVVQICT